MADPKRPKTEPLDPAGTYVLEETAITRTLSLEDLAELAAFGTAPQQQPVPELGPDDDVNTGTWKFLSLRHD